jgi:NADPH:quinone reductase-like Zn-dependent oxidoreductase
MVAKRMDADGVPNFEKMDVIAEIKRLRDGKGVDVAIKELEGRILEATRAPTGGATDWCTR